MSKTTNDLVNHPNKESLFDLPQDLILYLPQADRYHPLETAGIMGALSNTSQSMYALFKPKLDTKRLLITVLQGNEDAVIRFAKINPKLFFVKETANDYARDLDGHCRTLKNWSAYQAMFGTGDMDMLE